MFTRIAPQRAQHSSGFIVQVGGRYSVQYLHGDLVAEVEADMLCQTVPLYVETLVLRRASGRSVALPLEERKIILERIENGLEFLGIPYELCNGHS